jgi:NADH-quinone oxidoreductase subunit D
MKRTFGLGLACAKGDHLIDLGYSHPSSHGGLRIHCDVTHDIITSARIEIGFMHRGVEALFTKRDYRQGVMLASRHDWSGPSGGELAYALAIEELLGLIVPIRGSWIRVLICELDRIVSALTFLSAIPDQMSSSIRDSMNSHREIISHTLEGITGARMHHQAIKVGGVAVDVSAHHLVEIEHTLSTTTEEVDQWQEVLAASLERYRNIGVLGVETAFSCGASGIIARASGLALDTRIIEPYATYGTIEWISQSAPVADGDIPARVNSLLAEISKSAKIIEFGLDYLRGSVGESIAERTPKVLRLPQGEVYKNVEGSLGSSGVALFSDGGRSPARLRLRTASQGNLSALEPTLIGVSVLDIAMLVATWPFLSGDSDR